MLLTCAPISELPSNISTMGRPELAASGHWQNFCSSNIGIIFFISTENIMYQLQIFFESCDTNIWQDLSEKKGYKKFVDVDKP